MRLRFHAETSEIEVNRQTIGANRNNNCLSRGQSTKQDLIKYIICMKCTTVRDKKRRRREKCN